MANGSCKAWSSFRYSLKLLKKLLSIMRTETRTHGPNNRSVPNHSPNSKHSNFAVYNLKRLSTTDSWVPFTVFSYLYFRHCSDIRLAQKRARQLKMLIYNSFTVLRAPIWQRSACCCIYINIYMCIYIYICIYI